MALILFLMEAYVVVLNILKKYFWQCTQYILFSMRIKKIISVEEKTYQGLMYKVNFINLDKITYIYKYIKKIL